MKWIRHFFRVLYQFWVIILLSLPMILLYPFFKWGLKKRQFDRVYRMSRWLALYFSRISFIPVRCEWEGTLPDGPFVICSNHTSYLDILYLMVPFKNRFVFLGKDEILEWPYFKMFFKGMNIPVSRVSHRQAHRAFKTAGKELDAGVPIAIFPEGTIPRNPPELGRFKNGAFKLAKEKHVPIVPVTFLDNWRIFPEPQGFWGNLKPRTSRIRVHPPIYPGDKGHEELKAETYSVLGEALSS